MNKILKLRRRECTRRIKEEFVEELFSVKNSFSDVLDKKENFFLSIIIFLLKRIT